jgi:hypothetical protein
MSDYKNWFKVYVDEFVNILVKIVRKFKKIDV